MEDRFIEQEPLDIKPYLALLGMTIADDVAYKRKGRLCQPPF
jgi:hypothetical protein